MDISISKQTILICTLLVLAALSAILLLPRLTGRSLAQVAGFDSGHNAALAGVKAFYSVDYQSGPDVWAARLCTMSTQPACGYYQNTLAPFLWLAFTEHQTVVTAEASEANLVADLPASESGAASQQVWQVMVSLSQPWPQGDGRTTFPAHVLVNRQEDGWKFERLLLADELAKYPGGE